MHYLGQHFLTNEEAITKIVSAVKISAGDIVIEIGPGEGALTRLLAEQCQKVGAKLYAIEKDRMLVSQLLGELVSQYDNLEIVEGDALTELPKLINRLTDQSRRTMVGSPTESSEPTTYKLVGNIPYYITGQLLRVIGELDQKPSKTVLMIQKEVAQRVSSKSPNMNLLAAATQYWGSVHILFTLKPEDFTPPPEVDSAVIEIVPRPQRSSAALAGRPAYSAPDVTYYSFIKIAFKQPRKTLINNLMEGFRELQKAQIAEIMSENRLPATTRAQDLSIEELEKLAAVFSAR